MRIQDAQSTPACAMPFVRGGSGVCRCSACGFLFSRIQCRLRQEEGSREERALFLLCCLSCFSNTVSGLNSQKHLEVADHFLAGPRKREKGCLFLGILSSLEKTTSRALTHMARLATPCSRALWVFYGCAHARHALCALESRCSWHRYGLLSYFPATLSFTLRGSSQATPHYAWA